MDTMKNGILGQRKNKANQSQFWASVWYQDWQGKADFSFDLRERIVRLMAKKWQ